MIWFVLGEEEPEALNSNAVMQKSRWGLVYEKVVQTNLGVNQACCQNNLSLFRESWKLLTSLSRHKMSLGSVQGSSIITIIILMALLP